MHPQNSTEERTVDEYNLIKFLLASATFFSSARRTAYCKYSHPFVPDWTLSAVPMAARGT